MASTITRDHLTNDTGTPASPNGDGTVLVDSWQQAHIYDRIDQLLSGAGAYATLALGGALTVAGASGHAFGVAADAGYAINIGGTFSPAAAGAGGYAAGLNYQTTINMPVGVIGHGIVCWPTVNKAGSGTHSLAIALYLNATIGAGAATLTEATTLYVAGAPTGGSPTRAYAVHIAAGRTRIDDAIAMGGGAAPTLGTIGGSGPAVAAQNEWLRIETQNGVRYIPLWA